MRIGIFVACAGRQDGGPETYELELVRALARMDAEDEYRIFCLSRAAADSFGVAEAHVRFQVLRPRYRAISVPLSLPLAVQRARVDLLHATMYPPPFLPVGHVFTMHDVSPFAHPDFYPPRIRARLSSLVRRGVRGAKLIVCPSEYTRDTTAERFRVDPERISVVHHGIDARFRPPAAAAEIDTVRDRYEIRAPYALYVGKLMLRKNIVRMLEAFDRLRRSAPELTLVLCGRRFWDSRFLDEAIARLRLEDRVVELGYIPDADLPPLYAGAEMALYPTLFEGFGFPVLESMACGTPVITSNVSCLPEIAGGAALLVHPESVEEIAAAIERLHGDTSLRSALRAKGLARAATFTWQRAAEQMVAVYRRASAL